MSKRIVYIFCFFVLVACSDNKAKEIKEEAVKLPVQDSVTEERFMFVDSQDTTTVLNDEDHITRFKNGVIDKRGRIKNGKREGLWKSYYEDGTPWSETTFKDGIKNGKTTTFYKNGKKRYEGFYKDDLESGKWTYYDEKGNIVKSIDYE